MVPSQIHLKKRAQEDAFALVIALSLMAFVLVLLLTITTLVQVESGVASDSKNRLKAQQNALLGAYVAIGNLQSAVGADQRVTAQAEIGGSAPSKENFTGVWLSAAGSPADAVQWLASDWQPSLGNYETLPSPSLSDPEASNPSVTLVGADSVDLVAAPSDAVRVSLADTLLEENGSIQGSYAWWASGENAKASVQPTIENAASSVGAGRYRSVLSLANKDAADLRVLSAFAGDSIDLTAMSKVLSADSLALAGLNSAGLQDHFHDYTIASFGVAANVRDGGLKKDLSLAFELGDSDFNSSEFASAGFAPVNVLGTSLRAQPVFYDSNGGRGPSWHLLRDYYTIYQRMRNPLTDPVFPAQHFLPNHDELGFPTDLEQWEDLAAMRFDNKDVWRSGNGGDPLLSNTLPYLIRANYGPAIQRWVQLIGLQFEPTTVIPAGGNPALDYVRPIILVNPAAVYHNPYNVKVEHYGLMSVINHIRFNIILRSLPDNRSTNESTSGNWSMFKVQPGVIDAGTSEVYFGMDIRDTGFSDAGTPAAEDFFEPEHSTFVGFEIAVDPLGGVNLEVDFAPFASQSSSETQRWPVWQFHNMGSPLNPVRSAHTRDNGFTTDLFSYGGYQEDYTILQTIAAHAEWLGNPSLFQPNAYLDANRQADFTPVDTTQHLVGDAPKPYLIVDDYMKAADDSQAFPLLALSNPYAPMKSVTNLLNGEGYPVYGPSWRLNVKRPNVATGSAVLQSANAGRNAFWGSSYNSGELTTAPLELPVVPPTSIGHLQSANVALLNTMPALAIGNSFATPYLPRDSIVGTFNNFVGSDFGGQRRLYHDLSYYLNDSLWDEYFFSSYSVPYNVNSDEYNPALTPAGVSFDAAFDPSFSNPSLIPGTLPNSRMRLHLGDSEDLSTAKGKLFDSSHRPLASGVGRSAENLLIEGAFNVNSTSVDAWTAVLAAGRGGSIYRSTATNSPDSLPSDEIAFSRSQMPAEGNFTGNIETDNAWSGYRALNDTQIRTLAQNIVDELKARVANRGKPFTSLGEFVNRQLSTDDFGLAGLLQAAIDQSGLNAAFEVNSSDFNTFPHPNNVEKVSGGRAVIMGAAAHINQADILQGIGSFIQVRSDTYRIRSYGDVRDPVTGRVLSQAWIEVLVQRTPMPVYPNGTDPVTDPNYWEPDPTQGDFGRRFEVISIQFLEEDSV